MIKRGSWCTRFIITKHLMYVCVIYITGSARNSTYITVFWAVGQKDKALDYTLIAAGC